MSDFNFEAFIANAKVRTQSVTLYPLDLSEQIDAADRAAEAAKGSEKKRLETERDQLREQMNAAAATISVKALTSAQLLELQGTDGIEADAKQIAYTCVEPTFTESQARQILDQLPAAESRKIIATGTELTFTEVKTPDFSHAA